jgi:hypothetical protein
MRLTMFITVRTHVSSAWLCGWGCGCPCPNPNACPCGTAEDGEMGLDRDRDGVEDDAARKMCVALRRWLA